MYVSKFINTNVVVHYISSLNYVFIECNTKYKLVYQCSNLDSYMFISIGVTIFTI